MTHVYSLALAALPYNNHGYNAIYTFVTIVVEIQGIPFSDYRHAMVTTLSIHLLLLLLNYKGIPFSDYRLAMVTTLSIHLLLLLKYKSTPLSDY